MKIVHVINSLQGGGKERRMLQLVRGLRSVTFIEQCVIVFSPIIEYKDIADCSVKVIYICEKSRLVQCKELYKILKKEAPDIVHSWCNVPLIMFSLPIIAKIIACKYIAGFVADANVMKFFSKENISARVSFLLADAIISNSFAGLHAKGVRSERAHVVYNGFDFSRIPVDVDLAQVKKALNIQTKYVVGMFARFSKAKDYQSFFETAKKVTEINDDVSFIAVGQGGTLSYYEDYVRNNKIINTFILGFRKDVEEIMSICDISILFTNSDTHAEGISNAIMESMAMGKVVIATKGGGTPEIITHRETGYLIPPKGVDEAVGIINDVLSDAYCSNIRARAKQSIVNRFSLQVMVQKYMDIYKRVIK